MTRSRPQRKLNPALMRDERMLSLPIELRWLLTHLLHSTDAYGRAEAHPSLLRVAAFEFDPVTDEQVETMLLQLAEAGWIHLYSEGRRSYLQIVDWDTVASVDQRGVPELLPPPPPDRAALPRATRGEPAVEGGAEADEAAGAEAAAAGDGGRRPLGPEDIPWYCTKHPQGIGTNGRKCGPCGTSRKQHQAAAEGLLTQEEMAAIIAERDAHAPEEES